MLAFGSISELPVSAFLPRNLWPACTQSASSLIETSAARDSEMQTTHAGVSAMAASAARDSEMQTTHAGVSSIGTSAALSSSLKVTSC